MARLTKAIIETAWYESGELHENLFSTDLVTFNAVDTSKPYYCPVIICADRACEEAFVRRDFDGVRRLVERIDLTKDNANARLAKYQTHDAADQSQEAA